MRVIFIDIDGVLVLKDWGTPNWNALSCNALKLLCTEVPDLKLVLSSTWRHKPALVYHFMAMLQEWRIQNEVIGMTPDIALFKRDVEIMEYINNLARSRIMLDVKDYVTDYVAIDDAPEFFNNNVMRPKHIMIIDRNIGFTQEHAQHLIKRFGGKDGI